MRNPGRDLSKMNSDEKLNHTYWELASALGWIEAGETKVDFDLNLLLETATDTIWMYRSLSK